MKNTKCLEFKIKVYYDADLIDFDKEETHELIRSFGTVEDINNVVSIVKQKDLVTPDLTDPTSEYFKGSETTLKVYEVPYSKTPESQYGGDK